MWEATRVSLYDNTFTVAKLQSIANSLGYNKRKAIKGTIKPSRKLVVSANNRPIGITSLNSLSEEGVKTRDPRLTNQKAVKRIVECNDRKGANIVKSITEYELRESVTNSMVNNNIPVDKRIISIMASLSKLLLR